MPAAAALRRYAMLFAADATRAATADAADLMLLMPRVGSCLYGGLRIDYADATMLMLLAATMAQRRCRVRLLTLLFCPRAALHAMMPLPRDATLLLILPLLLRALLYTPCSLASSRFFAMLPLFRRAVAAMHAERRCCYFTPMSRIRIVRTDHCGDNWLR